LRYLGAAAYFSNRVPKPENLGDHLIVENKEVREDIPHSVSRGKDRAGMHASSECLHANLPERIAQ
jgi:hypothetical protein